MITSKQNQSVKRIASLKQKKAREELGLYVVEGLKMIFDACSFGLKICEVFTTEKNANAFENVSFPVTLVSDAVFKNMSDEVTPQGVLAVLEIPKSEAITSLSRCLLLDRVQDPGNVGTIIRLAAACNVKDILTIDCADPYSPKAVRSSMSGIYRVNVIKTTWQECERLLSENGVPLVCADMDGENIFDAEPLEKFCLCVGNEGQGISEEILRRADKTVSIPMEGGIESLNVSVATGVSLYSLLYINKRR